MPKVVKERLSMRRRSIDVELEAGSSSVSLRRMSLRRTRTSILPQYSITVDANSENGEVEETDQNLALEVLVGKSICQLCRLSPLNGLDYSKTKLKQYALKMKQYLANNLKTNTAITYSVEIIILENLKLRVHHPDALKIVVWGTNEEDNVKMLYNGILLSWYEEDVEASDSAKQSKRTHLPLLLEHGAVRVATAVKHILSKIFDCHIAPFSFAQRHLLLFSALLSGSQPQEGGARHVTFVYNVPYTRCNTKLTVDIQLDDVHLFWKKCFDSNENVPFDETNSRRLYEEFQKHIMEHHSIDVGALHLEQLTHPKGLALRTSGQIRLGDVPTAKLALKVLCEMATILKTVTPSLGTDYNMQDSQDENAK